MSVFILFTVEDDLSVMLAEKEKLIEGVSSGYSLDKNGLGFSLSLFPMLQKYSLIDDAFALLPLIVWPSTVRPETTIVLDF